MLADIAEPPNMKRAFEASLNIVSLTAQLESSTGISGLTVRGRRGSVQGISLTGWVAMLGMSALVVLCMYGVFVLVRRLRGGPDGAYTLVVKQQHK